MLLRNNRAQRLRRENKRAPTAERAAGDAETGGAVAAGGAAESACRNPSLPGRLQNHPASTVRSATIVRNEANARNEALVRNETTVQTTVRRRDTSPSCCPGSRSRNISAWHRPSRGRGRGLPL